MASLDVAENCCIAVMLWSWPDLPPALVQISGAATRIKIMTGALTEALMAGSAVAWLARLRSRAAENAAHNAKRPP